MCRSCLRRCRKSWISPTAATRLPRSSGNTSTCSERRCGSRRRRCEPADQSFQSAVPREEEVFFRGDHDPGDRADRAGVGAFLCLRLLAGQEPRAPDRRIGARLRAAEAAVRKNHRGAQPGKTRSAARSGLEEHRSRNRLATLAHGRARKGRSGRPRRILGIPPRLCATDRAGALVHEHTDRRRGRTADHERPGAAAGSRSRSHRATQAGIRASGSPARGARHHSQHRGKGPGSRDRGIHGELAGLSGRKCPRGESEALAMRLPVQLQRYADRLDAMSLRERVLIFLAVAVVIVAIADSALFDPILRRQKVSSQRIHQQEDEVRTMQAQVQVYAQGRTGDNANAKVQRLEKLKIELAALDRELGARRSELVPPERMAKMLYEIVKRNPDIELVSLRSLPATGLTPSLMAILGPGGLALYRHGIEITVSGSYLKMLNYVGQLERLPAKIMWGNMDLQAAAYPAVTLKITLYTLSPEKTWLLI